MTTIFISIASYLDPDLPKTIRSALENANRPDNLVFGVALQYYKEPMLPQNANIRTLHYHPDTRPGICKVRYNISNELYQGEDFFLQIDSHYTFTPGWDTKMIDAYHLISAHYETNKIVLLPLELMDGKRMTSRFKLSLIQPPDIHSEIMIQAVNPMPDNQLEVPENTFDEISWGRVGQILIPKGFMESVGLDPYSQVIQEIAYFSFRVIMSGYKFVQLHKTYLFHSDQDYVKEVWNNDKEKLSAQHNPLRFTSNHYKEGPHTWHEMSLAYIYNDFSKYAIKDAAITPQEFWAMQDQEQEYLDAKEYFDQVLHSNLL